MLKMYGSATTMTMSSVSKFVNQDRFKCYLWIFSQ